MVGQQAGQFCYGGESSVESKVSCTAEGGHPTGCIPSPGHVLMPLLTGHEVLTLPQTVLRPGDTLWSEFLIREKTKNTQNQLGPLQSQHPLITPLWEEENPGFYALGITSHSSRPPDKQATLWPTRGSSSLLPPPNLLASTRLWKTPRFPFIKRCLCSLPADLEALWAWPRPRRGDGAEQGKFEGKIIIWNLSALPTYKNTDNQGDRVKWYCGDPNFILWNLWAFETDPWGLNPILCPPLALPCGLLHPGLFQTLFCSSVKSPNGKG